MKIHEVSLKTGLTEKAIRLYIQNGLIHPHVEKGLYRNSYTFSETDIKELNEISVFRKAGFSLFEISLIKEMPEKLPELLKNKMLSLEMEIDEKKTIKEALSRLEVHELGNVSLIANTLRPAMQQESTLKEHVSKRPFYICILLGIFFLFLLYAYSKAGMFMVTVICSFLCFLIGLISCIMSIRYSTATSRARKLSNRGKGSIISIIEDHGFHTSFAVGNGNAGTKEPGIGGIWQIIFMLWNEIRPDCWFPVILYLNEDNTKESSTLLYGSFKNTWHIGQEIDIAWDDTTPTLVYPLNKHWISKKILCYTWISCISFLLSLALLTLLL